jgi:hypothetical protein
VSLFFTFYGEADVSTDDLLRLIVAVVGGSPRGRDTVFVPGMNVTAHRVDEGEEDSTGQHFGFLERITATFNFENLSSEEVSEHNTALMVAAVLAIFDRYPGRGVLLFNGERAVLGRLSDEVVFDSDWDDWLEMGEVLPLVAANETRKLLQPLM